MRFVCTLILWCLSLSLSAQSGVSVKTVTQAGTLHEQFQGESLERIRILKVKGVLNLQDLKFLNNELRLQDLDLTDVNFDSTVGKEGLLPGYMFERMKESLQFIRIPASVRYLGEGAFEGMTALQHIGVSGEILEVGKNAFRGCTKLSIQGDEFVRAEVIDDYAFADCAALVEIHLGPKLAKLGMKVFQHCKSLMRVSIDPTNESLLFIPEGAFFQCTSLQEVDIPNLVKSIDKSSFIGCSSLSQINLRTLVPPMLADAAFESRVHPMSVYVNAKSLQFYKRSGTWRRFRNYFIEAGSKTLYVADKAEERIRPNVTQPAEVYVPTEEGTPDDPKGSDNEDHPVESAPAEPVVEQPKEAAPKNEVEIPEEERWPEIDKPMVQTPVETPAEVERITSPLPKQEDQSFVEEVTEKHGQQPEPVQQTYFNSEVINPAVSALTFYVKGGIVHIEAPVKIKQLTILDLQGRSIFANKLSDTIYTTSISQASMRLIRAVYEGGVETKRFR